MSFTVIIPARLASTRLPDKPLLDIAGLPMIERVRRQAVASGAQRVIVATDSQAIVDVIQQHGGEAMLTDAAHRCGSDRLNEVATRLSLSAEDIIVNLQGDEPLTPPALLAAVAKALAQDKTVPMATVACPLTSWAELRNPNVVKLVCDRQGYALYFSRAPIPWDRQQPDDGTPPQHCLRHIGLYAYRAHFLNTFSRWPSTTLELTESLEQLRVLEHGQRIRVVISEQTPPPGVDTEDDLRHVRALLSAATDPRD